MATADLNGDSAEDVVILGQNPNSLTIFLAAPSLAPTIYTFLKQYLFTDNIGMPSDLVIADFDGDKNGCLDVAVIIDLPLNSPLALQLWTNPPLGNGCEGTLTEHLGNFRVVPKNSPTFAGGVVAIAAADLDGDKKIDIVIAGNKQPNNMVSEAYLSVLLNEGSDKVTNDGVGWFRPLAAPDESSSKVEGKFPYPLPSNPSRVRLGDLNGDKKIDIAATIEDMGGKGSVMMLYSAP